MKKRYLLGGTLIGAANGAFGGGGGMVAVPLLEGAGVPSPSAHATAIAAVLPACLASGAVYLASGLVPLSLLVPVALGVTAGGLLGARLLSRLRARALDVLFSALMLLAGVRMLFP